MELGATTHKDGSVSGKICKLAKQATCYVVSGKTTCGFKSHSFRCFLTGTKPFCCQQQKINVSVTLVLSRFIVHKGMINVNNPFVPSLVS